MQHVWLVSFVEFGLPGSVLGVFATCSKAADYVESHYDTFSFDYNGDGHGEVFHYIKNGGGDTIRIAKHTVQK